MMSRLLQRLRTAEILGGKPASSPDALGAVRRCADFLAALGLVLCAWVLHGHGLTVGFWFDDHNHLELCRQNGFADLAGGNRFDWTGRITHVWWAKKDTGWAYYRPLTVAMRVAQLRAFGLNPLPFHVVHLTLFSLSVLLFYGLLRRCGWGPRPAGAAGLFFVLHPANAFTTPWLANDGPVLVGLWLLMGLWLMHASARAGHRRPGLVVGVLLCYALAMFSRENGVMVGPLLLLFDCLRRRRPAPIGPADVTAPSATWRRRGACTPCWPLKAQRSSPSAHGRSGPPPCHEAPIFTGPRNRGSWLGCLTRLSTI